MKKNKQERVMSLLLFVGAIMVVAIITGFSSGFSITKQSDRITEISAPPAVPVPLMISTPVQDTIRDPKKHEPIKEAKELDWDQIKEDMEAARIEAMEEIDWDQIKEDMEAARMEVMEEIDWDQIKEDMEAARIEAMEEIDWDEMKQELEHSFSEMQIDLEEMKREIEESIREIDLDEIRREMKNTRHSLDSLFIEKDI